MDLLPDTSSIEEIFLVIRKNAFLQDIVVENKHLIPEDRKKLIDIINKRIIAWNKSKVVRFDVPKHCLENCQDIYFALNEIPDLKIEAIAKLIAEYATIAYSGCYNCGAKRILVAYLSECIYCRKMICKLCVNLDLYRETQAFFCNGCAAVVISLYLK